MYSKGKSTPRRRPAAGSTGGKPRRTSGRVSGTNPSGASLYQKKKKKKTNKKPTKKAKKY
mgnify:FL=1|tara:strand:- start:860 stop:1039 length:180 start_codon:yes stop_codon:yes gene_type:complete